MGLSELYKQNPKSLGPTWDSGCHTTNSLFSGAGWGRMMYFISRVSTSGVSEMRVVLLVSSSYELKQKKTKPQNPSLLFFQ